jgi:hypothetical protein
MADFAKIYAVFLELEQFMRSTPNLAGFVAVAAELAEQARLLNEGVMAVPRLSATAPTTIPDRELARGIVRIISGLPTVDIAVESKETQLLVAMLLGNLVDGVTAAIYRSYPDVVPRRSAPRT